MSLNIAFIKNKSPYFVLLVLVAMYAQVLFHGVVFTDLFIVLGICGWAICKPNMFCIFSKSDKYIFMTELPFYFIMMCIFAIACIIGIHFQMLFMSHLRMILMCISMSSFLAIIDMSRYTD